MSHFRNRGLETSVDTTKEAEFDFAGHQIDPAAQERIARTLKEMPRSLEDRGQGDVRLREIAGWDVLFVITAQNSGWVITIVGVTTPGEAEPTLNYLLRSGAEALPPAVRMLLKGKRNGS